MYVRCTCETRSRTTAFLRVNKNNTLISVESSMRLYTVSFTIVQERFRRRTQQNPNGPLHVCISFLWVGRGPNTKFININP